MRLPPALAEMDRKRLAALGVAAALIVIFGAFALVAALGAERSGGDQPASTAEIPGLDRADARPCVSPDEATLAAARDAGALLVYPGDDPRLPRFPLALDPDAGYTAADILRNFPDLGKLDMEALRRERKALVDAIYETVE